jgi:hypothetical protein
MTDVLTTDAVSQPQFTSSQTVAGNPRARALAARIEEHVRALDTFAAALTDEQWTQRVPHDGRTFGVIVHHVAIVYPLEVDLATRLADGQPITGVTMADVHAMNAQHAIDHDGVTKDEALALLRANSRAAADAIRGWKDANLDRAAPVSLYDGAVLTAQFVLEDHAVRHSLHHLAAMQRALGQA